MGFTASWRRHSARLKRIWAPLFLVAAVAFPTTASAVPANVAAHWYASPLVRADDGLSARLPAQGTDVAAPDQQASNAAPAPSSLPSDGGSDFDWTAALLGAGACLAAFAIASALGARNRRGPVAS